MLRSWLQAGRLQVSLAHLAGVPVQEGLAAEHASELLGDTWVQILSIFKVSMQHTSEIPYRQNERATI